MKINYSDRSKSSVILLFLVFILNSGIINASTNSYYSQNDSVPIINNNHIYSSKIKTITLSRYNYPQSYPIIDLSGDEKFLLQFDYLSADIHYFNYSLELFNSDWTPVPLSTYEYIEGFDSNPINDYENSMNTLIPYVHYTLELPNTDIKILKPGNYVIKVTDSFNDSIMFTRRFMIANNKITIKADVKRPQNPDLLQTSQEIDFTIGYEDFEIDNPYDNIKVVILQNGRWTTKVDNLIPQFVRNKELVYNYDYENVFNANNEFRFFNCKNTRFISENIKYIEYIKPYYHIELETDISRAYKQYFYYEDLNGNFSVDLENSDNPDLEADYVYIYFSLPWNVPFLNGNIYVTGNFNGWNNTKTNLMIYNFDKNEYQLKLLLKQGYYNYIYAYKENTTGKIDTKLFEGNHYQTENDYMILVYYKDFYDNYDKLIGYKLVNSMNKK